MSLVLAHPKVTKTSSIREYVIEFIPAGWLHKSS